MAPPAPSSASPWEPRSPEVVADALRATSARWWLSGGVALDHWLGRGIRERPHTDVSTTAADLAQFVADLPSQLSAWVEAEDAPLHGAADSDGWVAFADVDADADVQPVLVWDAEQDAWAFRVNVEDGTPVAWLYRRDPRLQLPWATAVEDVRGIPTGAPQVQLVWKALRPRPEDDVDRDAVLPALSPEARAWYETAILRLHPHSSWSIHVRSPMFPAKASWNRPSR